MTTSTVTIPACLCNHVERVHGEDGCNIADCGCSGFITPDQLLRPTKRPDVTELLKLGKASAFKRTVTLTEKIAVEINDLRGRLSDERQAAANAVAEAARRAELQREVDRLAEQLAAAKAKLNGPVKAKPAAPKPLVAEGVVEGVVEVKLPCPEKDCAETFDSKQRLGAHRRWDHHNGKAAAAG